MRRSVPLVLVLSFISVGTAPAQPLHVAQPVSVGDRDLSRSFLKQGNQLMALGRFEEALAAFQHAHDAFPSPRLFASMAEAYRALGRFADSANHFQRYLDSTDADPRLRADADRILQTLDPFLGRLSVTIHAPPGTDVELRIVPGDWAPETTWLRVEPGTYDLEVRVAGTVQVQRQHDTVAAGVIQPVSITIPATVVPATGGAPSPPPDHDAEPAAITPVASHAATPRDPPTADEPRRAPAATLDGKSPAGAFTLSLVGTIASAALVAAQRYEGDDPIYGGLALAIAPTLGHYYAGELWTRGLLVRAVGVVPATIGYLLLDEHQRVGASLLSLGVIAMAGGAIWDVTTAAETARQWNQRRLTLSAAAVSTGRGLQPGFAVSGRW